MRQAWLNEPPILHRLVRAQAQATPDRIAAVYQDQWLSYEDLAALSGNWACFLRRLGVNIGTLVGIHLERSLDLPILILATLEAGGVCVPLEPTDPPQRLAAMIEEIRPSLILTQRRLRQQLPAVPFPILEVDEQTPGSALPPETQCGGNMLAFVLLTSGSTGIPKGVMISHAAAVARMYRSENDLPAPGNCMAIMKTPISNSPFLGEMFAPLLHGCYFVIARAGGHQDIPYLGSLIIDFGVSHISMPTAILRAFLEWPDAVRCRSLRAVYCGGEAVTQELRDCFASRFETARFVLTYGTTEAGHKLSRECRTGEPLEAGRIGRAIPRSEVYLLNEALEPVPAGEVGEFYLGGPRLALGYLNRAAWTADRFVPNPFSSEGGERLYRSGDLGCLRPNGEFEFRGRYDQLVKIRGCRVELGEVEGCLRRYDAIHDVAVVAQEGQAGDRRLVAYLVAKENAPLKVSELRDFLRQELPDVMVPSVFVMLEALPLTPSGKTDRKALSVQIIPERSRPVFTAPRSPLEVLLSRIWGKLLGFHQIGIHDDFFELGGHSLLAARMVERVQRATGKSVPIAALFRAPTVAGLAREIETNKTQAFDLLEPIRPAGSGPVVLCFGSGLVEHLPSILPSEYPLYWCKPENADGKPMRFGQVEDLATHYCRQITGAGLEGPYVLCGFSYGGLVAFETARQLFEHNGASTLLFLVEPSLIDQTKKGPASRVVYHLRKLPTVARGQKTAYAYAKAKATVQNVRRRIRQLYCGALLSLRMHVPVGLRWLYVEDQYRESSKRYVPRPVAGRVVLVHSKHYPESLVAQWGRLAPEGITVRRQETAVHVDLVRDKQVVEDWACDLRSSLEGWPPASGRTC